MSARALRVRRLPWRRLMLALTLAAALLVLVNPTAAPAQAQDTCDVIWCATLTVGVDPGDSNWRGFDTDLSPTIGALSPRTFTYNEGTVRITYLVVAQGGTFYFGFTGDLGGQALTLQVGDTSFDIGDPGTETEFEWEDSPFRWNNGDSLDVKLSGVPPSDDATLSSIVIYTRAFEDLSRVNFSPAFNSDVTEYFAIVSPLRSEVIPWSIATTEPAASTEFIFGRTRDSSFLDNDYYLELNRTNTFHILVTATDGETTKVYTFHIVRGVNGTFGGQLSGLPDSHDESTAFSVSLAFDEDVVSPLTNILGAIEVSGGSKSNLAKVGGSNRKFTFTVTPDGSKRIFISVGRTNRCTGSTARSAHRTAQDLPGCPSTRSAQTTMLA